MPVKILLVEDEAAIRQMLIFALQQQGFDVLEAGNTQIAFELLANNDIDLLILDWMLPGISGVELCRRLKKDASSKHIPIIMLTARAEEEDKIQGLNAGADDYLTKPFSPRELIARINAVLRRVSSNKISDSIMEFDGLQLNEKSYRVTSNREPLQVGPTEFKLLHFFMSNPDRVFTRAQLLDNVWGNDVYVEERTVDVHIRRLRKALEPGQHDHMIQTVRGAGYRFSLN